MNIFRHYAFCQSLCHPLLAQLRPLQLLMYFDLHVLRQDILPRTLPNHFPSSERGCGLYRVLAHHSWLKSMDCYSLATTGTVPTSTHLHKARRSKTIHFLLIKCTSFAMTVQPCKTWWSHFRNHCVLAVLVHFLFDSVPHFCDLDLTAKSHELLPHTLQGLSPRLC